MSGLIEKVQQYARQTDGGCWEWTGALKNGSAPSMRWGTVGNVRRFILLDRGEKMRGFVAGTTCGNARCVNPEHVAKTTRSQVTTAARAAWDAATRTLHAMRSCAAARPKLAKITMEDARAIRIDERRQADIAADYGIAQRTVSRIKRGELWKEYVAASNPFSQLMR